METNWKHNDLTDEELKTLVKDVYDNKVFTSLQISKNEHLIGSIFMPVMFIGSPPSKPNFPEDEHNIKKNRKNKLDHIDALKEWKIELKQWKDDAPQREQFMQDIGMIYEYYGKEAPRSINGYPIFFSCNIVSKDDTKRFFEKFKEYEIARKEFEEKFK